MAVVKSVKKEMVDVRNVMFGMVISAAISYGGNVWISDIPVSSIIIGVDSSAELGSKKPIGTLQIKGGLKGTAAFSTNAFTYPNDNCNSPGWGTTKTASDVCFSFDISTATGKMMLAMLMNAQAFGGMLEVHVVDFGGTDSWGAKKLTGLASPYALYGDNIDCLRWKR